MILVMPLKSQNRLAPLADGRLLKHGTARHTLLCWSCLRSCAMSRRRQTTQNWLHRMQSIVVAFLRSLLASFLKSALIARRKELNRFKTVPVQSRLGGTISRIRMDQGFRGFIQDVSNPFQGMNEWRTAECVHESVGVITPNALKLRPKDGILPTGDRLLAISD